MPQNSQTPTPPPQKTTEQKVLEWTVPINRSGWAIAAGYVALFSFPFAFLGPVSVALGIIGLLDARKKQKGGKGRSIFAIVYGGLTSIFFIWILTQIFSTPK